VSSQRCRKFRLKNALSDVLGEHRRRPRSHLSECRQNRVSFYDLCSELQVRSGLRKRRGCGIKETKNFLTQTRPTSSLSRSGVDSSAAKNCRRKRQPRQIKSPFASFVPFAGKSYSLPQGADKIVCLSMTSRILWISRSLRPKVHPIAISG